MKKILLIIILILAIFYVIVLATDIDIGSAVIDRNYNYYEGYTLVNKENPANATGKITSVEIWAAINLVGCEVATFYVVSGNNLSTRDSVNIGNVTAGSKQTFNVDLDVQEGDYIGIYASSGAMEGDLTGYDGCWNKIGDFIPCVNQTFTLLTDDAVSLYGMGTTTEEEANAIFFGMNF